MVKKRITEAVSSNDVKTKRWKSTFAAGRMAYETGELRQAESLIARALEMARDLPESSFAVNSSEIGWAVVCIAQDRSREAATRLDKVITRLKAHGDAAHKELLAVAIRFYAESLANSGDERAAEKELQKSAAILQELGPDASVQLAYTLADLCGLYAAKERYSEAENQITKAMKILGNVMGPDCPEYRRTDMIYQLCMPMSQDERLDVASDGIMRMEYEYGAKHPHIKRALNRYIEALEKRGDSEKLEAAKERFGIRPKVKK